MIHSCYTIFPESPLLLPSLRLFIPPLRLVSAAMWQVVHRGNVQDYGMVEEFISTVSEIIPEILNADQKAQLLLGLRARVRYHAVEKQHRICLERTKHWVFVNLHGAGCCMVHIQQRGIRSCGDSFWRGENSCRKMIKEQFRCSFCRWITARCSGKMRSASQLAVAVYKQIINIPNPLKALWS